MLARNLFGAALLAVATPVVGQVTPVQTVRLAEGVYAILQPFDPKDPSDANTTVIINEHDVVVVDANITPASTRRVIEEIRKLTRKPVRYVINTHVHSDHMYGNMVYAETFPGVEFIAHVATREDYLANDVPTLEKNLKSEYPAIIARYEAALRRGTTRDGRLYSPEELRELRHEVATYREFLEDMKGFRHVPPTITLTDSLVIHRGERTIHVKHLGRANTRGDVVVFLPREGIVATGDMIVAPVPFAWESYPGEWSAALGRLRQLPVNVLVPGHGPLQKDWSYVDLLNRTLNAALTETRDAVRRDTSLVAVRKAVTLDAFRLSYVREDSSRSASFDQFVAALVERAYLDVLKRIPQRVTNPPDSTLRLKQ